ncbi:MAG TPA: DinB family protein [Planctomycetota bacterium]|nr:DinB family protein [Planctomycetota bacterium]
MIPKSAWIVSTLAATLSVATFLSTAAAQGERAKPASAPAPKEANLTPAERTKALDLVRKSEKETLAAVEKLSDAQWSWKPAPDKWSVGECVEHIATVEAFLLPMVEKTASGAPDPKWNEGVPNTEELEKQLLDRSKKFQAPEPVRPTGKLTRAEVMAKYKEARTKTKEFFEKAPEGLKAYVSTAGPVGRTNAYQQLIFIPLHNLRHNQQIAEVKATEGFPAK